MISRRRFLGSGTVMAAGAIATSVASVGRPWLGPLPGAPAAPRREQFERWVGSTFRAHLDALRIVPLRLDHVSDTAHDRTRALPGHEHFTLRFQGPAATPLGQQTYRMDHAQGGTLAIFIVPMERRQDVLTYEAVFHCPSARSS